MLTENPMQIVADELRPILNRVRRAKEILGMGDADCVYEANKQLEPVLFRLSDLVQELSKPVKE
jgi:hypothetical protein